MRMRAFGVGITTLILAVATTGAVIAASGQSTPDEQFLGRARSSAPANMSDQTLVGVGRDTCRGFRNGDVLSAVITREMEAGLSPTQAAVVTRAAIDAYCPEIGKILLTPS